MTAALSAGVADIAVFPSPDAARAARPNAPQSLLCGEVDCLRPADFDLGNSPGDFSPRHAGRSLLMATTNGTAAILAAMPARQVLVGALINAAAIARALAQINLDVTLLCAGTRGEIATEDIFGAGAVLSALFDIAHPIFHGDSAKLALDLFDRHRQAALPLLLDSTGGRNVTAAGLTADVHFAARLSAMDVVGAVSSASPGNAPVIIRWTDLAQTLIIQGSNKKASP